MAKAKRTISAGVPQYGRLKLFKVRRRGPKGHMGSWQVVGPDGAVQVSFYDFSDGYGRGGRSGKAQATHEAKQRNDRVKVWTYRGHKIKGYTGFMWVTPGKHVCRKLADAKRWIDTKKGR